MRKQVRVDVELWIDVVDPVTLGQTAATRHREIHRGGDKGKVERTVHDILGSPELAVQILLADSELLMSALPGTVLVRASVEAVDAEGSP